MQETEREDLLAIYHAAIDAVAGDQVVQNYLQQQKSSHAYHVIAIGKVADAMMRGALTALQHHFISGLVISKAETFSKQVQQHSNIQCVVGDHPIPDQNSLQAGQVLLRYIQQLPSDAKCLLLISGGASSLVEVLTDNLSLEQLQQFNHYLLASGLNIHSVNMVRKRLSCIKNGGLWNYLQQRQVLCLIISDVYGDDPKMIGSGLLFASSETSQDESLAVLLPSYLYKQLPPTSLSKTAFKHRIHNNFTWQIVACLDDAKYAAKQHAIALGYSVTLIEPFMQGAAEQMGIQAATMLKHAKTAITIWGGETTVQLPEGCMQGGRNQQLALAAAIALHGQNDHYILAIASDGVDGTTDEAGALVDGRSVQRGELFGLSAPQCLQEANANLFLEESGDLIYTGVNPTNVMDFLIALKVIR